MVEDLSDPRRSEPAFIGTEREMVETWLDFHRLTLLLKCEGLNDEQRKHRPIPTSKLSLQGLVRHMGEVERNWFHRVLLKAPETPPIWADPAVEDSEFVPLLGASWDADVARWQEECERSRSTTSRFALDDTGLRHGEPCSLRWIYVQITPYRWDLGHGDHVTIGTSNPPRGRLASGRVKALATAALRAHLVLTGEVAWGFARSECVGEE